MSYMSVDGERSATQHAGIPAIITVPFTQTAAGEKQIVAGPEDGRRIRLHGYMISPAAAGIVTLATSGGDTTVIGQTTTYPVTQQSPINGLLGLATLDPHQDLMVSGAVPANGNVTYSIVQ